MLIASYSVAMWFVIPRLEAFSTHIQTLDKAHLDKSDALRLVIFTFTLLVIELAFFVVAFVTIRRLASWHGAEHMAFASYERGRLEIEDIAKENRVSPKCGGRLFLPLFLAAAIAIYISKHLNISSLFILPFFYELVLQIDGRKGFDKIPPFAQASILLQRYFTTKQPGMIEMKTAQTALLALVNTHRISG